MSRSSKTVTQWPLVWMTALLLVVPQAAPRPALAQGREHSAEKQIFDSVNHERFVRGLSQLKWDEDLAKAAREHALRMAERNTISHQFPGEPDLSARIRHSGARAVALAENVAEGPSATGLHAQWMKSPPHRANVLDPKLNSLGVAVAERNGQFFGVEDFSQAVFEVSFDEQENQVNAQLKKRGLRLLNDSKDAQLVCKDAGNRALSRPPAYLVRYSTADLGSLPDILTRALASGRYHAAAVAACNPGQPNEYAGYQISVLLYE